ncbi:NAD-binding Rossmann fold oxidoreductase family protein, partial [Metarhizium hybridum]
MTQPIGVAIIGSGLFVKAEHLPAVLGNARLDLKALYSRSLKSAQETAGQIKDAPQPALYAEDAPGSTYADLLRREDVQAVIVALPIVSQPATESGAVGTYCHSAGTLASAFEWDVACERGAVRSDGDLVTVTGEDGAKVETRFERTSGVREEVDAWAGSILDGGGEAAPMQSAREALADLEFLEAMFASGAEGGEERRLVLQRW